MKNIVIIPNDNKDIELKITKKLISLLMGKANLYMDKKYSYLESDIAFAKREELFSCADFVIVLGGDGTILEVSEHCGIRNIPIIGINLGRIGFMAEVDVCEMEAACNAIISGSYKIEKRMMMDVTILKDDKSYNYYALNDVVVSKLDSSMVAIEIYSDNEKINEYKADGVIIATPTGSTGYSLSAGGPVADPTMELFIASPICAHELHARSALMPSDKVLNISLSDELGREAIVTLDGKVKEKICVGDKVVIKKSEYYTDIVKIKNKSFYDVLTDKLK
ncbi:MAG: NAD(+)/NADH kinase [Clostridia bacterium]|nr:NAD(+)/NADH kinase [Clostridia bacterium]